MHLLGFLPITSACGLGVSASWLKDLTERSDLHLDPLIQIS